MRVLITGGKGQLSRTVAPFEFVLCSALAAAESRSLAVLRNADTQSPILLA
jgi:hypothetical protein